ncbi:LPXTG cell wall anchor domain-containing protein [Kitasatospora sp. NPDC004615]|uniref:DUF7507 domain-containing protein n=1 Tax=Kitasatospora sp. NPDC004615 TaxID=3364017 RepID=UPI00367575E2
MLPLVVALATASASFAWPAAAHSPAAGHTVASDDRAVEAPVPVTLSKTGTDVATGSTTQTSHGGTVRWVVSKTNPAGVPVDATITDVIQGGPGSVPQRQTYVPGSLQVPPGYSRQWSTDGGASFADTDQGTATNVVQAHNPDLASPATGVVVQIPPPFTPVNTATGGDGFTPILYTATINGVSTPEVWNIYHHGFSSPESVVCTDLLTNGPCPAPDGSPASWPQALNSSVPGTTTGDLGSTRTPTYVQIGSKLYYAAISRDTSALIGVGCIDLQAQASCGFTPLQTGEGLVVGGVVQAPNQHLYAVSGTGEILCYDAAANVPCGTFDIGLPPNEGQVSFSGDYAGIMRTIEGKIYVTDNQLAPLPTVMSCFDPSTNAACAGWPTPKIVATPTTDEPARADNVFEMYDAAGTVTGVCTIVGGFYQAVNPAVGTVECFDLTGNPIAAPPGLSALVSTNLALGEANFQVPLTITAPNGHLETEFPFWIYRGITPTLNSTSYCYDWNIQGPCAQYGADGVLDGPPNVNGGNTSPYGYAYDGQCKYGLGDTGYLFSIDPVTGASPCQKTRTQSTINPADFYCDGASGHVQSYGTVKLFGIDPSVIDFTQSSVTVLAADGSTVGTFPFNPATETADISSVPVADSPIQVIANLTLNGGETFPANVRMEVTFVGDAPQICFETTVAKDCTVTSVSNQASAVTNGQPPNFSNTVTLQVPAGPECTADLTVLKEVCASPNAGDCGPGGPGPWASTTTLPPGGTAYWRITATNVGPTDITGITLDDPVTPSCAANAGTFDLPVGTSHQIFCNLPGITQPTTNTVTASFTGPDGSTFITPPSEATADVAGVGALEIQKTPDATGPFRLDDKIPYTYTVTNTGTELVHDITVTDNLIAPVICDLTTLNPGQSTLCHGSYVVTAADVQAGHVTNTAQANGTDANGVDVHSPPVDVTVPVVGTAELAIQKTPDSAGPFHVGDTVTYTYTITNLGTATVHNLAVTDDHVASVTCNTTVLSPGESTLCHGSYVVTAADVSVGHVTNTAHAEGRDPEGQPVVSPPGEATVPVVGIAELAIEKVADSAGPFHVGETVSYTYTVTNTGTATVHNLTVSDDHVAVVTCGTTTLNPGQSTLCHGSYVVTAADVSAGHVTNTAHAEGTDPEGGTVLSPPAEVTVPVLGEALLTIQKAADSAGPFHVGDTVEYTYTVTNTGTATVHNLTVTDDHIADVDCDTATLNPGESTLCHGSYVITAADVLAGHVTNTAVAHGTDPEGQPVQSPPGEATINIAGDAVLTIQKVADSAGPFHVGDTVNYTYTVTNAGTAPVHDLDVSDDRISPVTCDRNTLPAGDSTLCHGSYVVTAADVQAGHVTNTAVASGLDPENEPVVSPPAEATVPVVGEAALAIEKVADSAGPFHVGDTVNYTYTVTNTGTAAVHNLTVADNHVAVVTCDATTLNPGASTLCHGSYIVTAADVAAGHVTNTAHAEGTDPEGQTVLSPPAEATVPVVGEAQLTIEKTADSAGPFHVGETVNYTYTVTNTGTAAVHNLTVADDHVASVTCGTTTLNPGASTLCHGSYVITAADVAAGHVTNTAHAHGTDPEGEPVVSPPGEATVTVVGEARLSIEKTADSAGPFHVGDTVQYTYTVTNTGTAVVHNVTVADDHVASVTCDATTLNPGQSTLCHGSYVITAADAAAGHVTNTAHANGTDPEGRPVVSPPGEATVTVVGEAQLSIEKKSDSAGPFHVGDTVHYTYTVTNTGTVVLHNVTVSDDHVASVACDATTLNPGASTLCHGTYVITAADAAAGHVMNVAHASGIDPSGDSVESPPGEVDVPVVGEARLSIVKKADGAGPFRAGDVVQYTYTVTNTGAVAVHDVAVSDDHVASVTCDATTLNPGQSTVCHGSYTITEEDVEAGHVTNKATANGTDPEGHPVVSPPGEATVQTVSGASSLSVTKQSDVSGSAKVGDTITYTYTVTNTGSTVLTDVSVSDDRVSPVVCESTTLEPGQSTTCRGTYVVTEEDAKAGHVTNIATASARDPQGQLVQSRPVSLCVTVSECPEKEKGEGCVKVPRPGGPSKPPHAGGGHLPDTGSPAGLAAAGLAGGGLLTLGGVLLYRARRRAGADRFVG